MLQKRFGLFFLDTVYIWKNDNIFMKILPQMLFWTLHGPDLPWQRSLRCPSALDFKIYYTLYPE